MNCSNAERRYNYNEDIINEVSLQRVLVSAKDPIDIEYNEELLQGGRLQAHKAHSYN